MLRKISVLLNDRVTISRIPLLQSNCQALLTLSSTRCLHCHSLGCHLNDDPSAVIWDSLSILTESFLTFRKIVATSTMLLCTMKHRISFARGRERDEETRSCDGESTRRLQSFISRFAIWIIFRGKNMSFVPDSQLTRSTLHDSFAPTVLGAFRIILLIMLHVLTGLSGIQHPRQTQLPGGLISDVC